MNIPATDINESNTCEPNTAANQLTSGTPRTDAQVTGNSEATQGEYLDLCGHARTLAIDAAIEEATK